MKLLLEIGFHENKTLKMLYFINGFFTFVASLFGPLYALYVGEIKSGPIAISFSYTVFILASTVFLMIMSSYGDRLKNKALVVMISFLIRSGVWLGFAFISTFLQLILIQIVSALGDALGGPTMDTLFAEHLDKKEHVRDYADWRILAYMAIAVGTMLGGYIIAMFSFKVMFVMMSILALVPAVTIYFTMVRKKVSGH